MKLVKPLCSLFVLIAMLTFSHCSHKKKSDPQPPTQVEKVTTLLTASTWSLQSLTIDGVADATFFQGLKLTFTSSGFTAVNGAPVWPSSGTWSFTDATAQSFKRDDGTVVTIENISDSALQVSLQWTETTTARVSSVSGKHVFTFSK